MAKPAAVVALFDTPNALMEAIPQVRDKQLGRFEAYTPYPLHGLSQALGIKDSPLGKIVFGTGLTGAVLALLISGLDERHRLPRADRRLTRAPFQSHGTATPGGRPAGMR